MNVIRVQQRAGCDYCKRPTPGGFLLDDVRVCDGCLEKAKENGCARTVTTFTTAPVDYDGFSTKTVRVVRKYRDKDIREVITPEEHATWQRMRYGSGGYIVRTIFEDLPS